MNLEAILKSLEAEGIHGCRFLVVNMPELQGNATLLGAGTSLPVLQDTDEARVFEAYRAWHDDIIVIDGNGFVREGWKGIDLASQKTLVIERVRDIAGHGTNP